LSASGRTDPQSERVKALGLRFECVDQISFAVEHGAGQPARVLVGDRRAAGLAAQFHGSAAEDGHVCAGAPERPRLDRHN
jgi:hypothetical protein